MTEKKEAEKAEKSDALYSEDTSELVDIYVQMDEMFGKAKGLKTTPTSEDIQKLATSIFIQRNNNQGRAERPNKSETAPASGETRDCPNCGKVLHEKTGKSGKTYFACDECKGFVNSDGTFAPFKKR